MKIKRKVNFKNGKPTIKALDKIWRDIIISRAKKKCEFCGSSKHVQAHHIVPRSFYATRWNIENGVALCRRHHLYFAHRDVIAFYDWVKNVRDLDALRFLRGLGRPDLELTFINLKQQSKVYS